MINEFETRKIIDEQLRKVGWEVDSNNLSYSKGTRPQRGRNIAIAEYPTENGFADYVLFVGTEAVAVIEAKANYKDVSAVIDCQCKEYSRTLCDVDEFNNFCGYKVPFTFATNGRAYCQQLETKSGIWFLDLRESNNTPKALHGWISPFGIVELLKRNISVGNEKLKRLSLDLLRNEDGLNLRDYQIEAIQSVEQAIISGQKNILVAMATGTGKTRTVLGMIYRFLKTARFRRILFLVDRNSLGEQAQNVFSDVKLEDLLPLDKIYNVGKLGENCTGRIREIYQGAVTNIEEPKNLEKIISSINALDWYSAREEGLGNLYEGLLEKNANEKKSGAGQYFTPRVLIDVIVRLMKPKAGELCNDPACGTFGFMIAAAQYVRNHTDDFFDLSPTEQIFQMTKAFTGCELVHDTHRLALMNAMLHGLDGRIIFGDTLSEVGKSMKNFDLILSNPPFGTKKGGERATRDDLTFPTSNKQLNFLQHFYRSLKSGGRAAVVLPDNVLFADGDGERIRVDFMNKCNLHTVLRLPTGIFYAKGVKTNVLFFTRGMTDNDNTSEVWFYDLRTNMPSFGVTNPLRREHFLAFERAFEADDRRATHDERFNVFTREQIAEKKNSLDLGLIRDDSLVDYDELPDPIELGEEAIDNLQEATDLLQGVVNKLRALEVR